MLEHTFCELVCASSCRHSLKRKQRLRHPWVGTSVCFTTLWEHIDWSTCQRFVLTTHWQDWSLSQPDLTASEGHSTADVHEGAAAAVVGFFMPWCLRQGVCGSCAVAETHKQVTAVCWFGCGLSGWWRAAVVCFLLRATALVQNSSARRISCCLML